MRYRPEVDGLRALAVLPVIFFHAGFAIFSGGFVGVDVFFVISGYLITTLLVIELKDRRFTIAGFYERRARRLLPALFVVVIACFPFAWFWMLPEFLEDFGQSAVATVFFSNNFLLWLTAGYFEIESGFRPLLHTWSLGVEEQYYLLYPLFLAVLWRFGRRWLLPAIAALAITSLLLAQAIVPTDPDGAFYLLPTRAWELMVGALVALYLMRRPQPGESVKPSVAYELAGALGLGMILFSVVAFDRTTQIPGIPALVPVLGAALIILSVTPQTYVGKLMTHRAAVLIGLISYSAYLWHYPLFTFARLRSLEPPSAASFVPLIFLTLLLSYMTWRWVEVPFRNRAVIRRRQLLATLGAGFLLVGSAGAVLHLNSGFVDRQSALNQGLEAGGIGLNAAFNLEPMSLEGQPFEEPDAKNVLVWGDSHARDFINAALENGYMEDAEISYSTVIPRCMDSEADLPAYLTERVAQADSVIYALPTYDSLLPCLRSDLRFLREAGVGTTLVVGIKNFGWNVNAVMLLDEGERYSYRAAVLDEFLEENELMAREFPRNYVDVLATLIDADNRVPVFTKGKELISQDTSHLTRAGARFVGKRVFSDPLLQPLK